LGQKRYPGIVEAVLKNRQKQFVFDGAVVILGVDGVPDFGARAPASMTTRCSSTPSTSWRSRADDLRDLR
jgi:hypothetical protein